jgi:hypothetical protein
MTRSTSTAWTSRTTRRPAPASERISDSCGYAVPFMEYVEDRPLHTQRFGRETDESFNEYCEKKPYVATSLDGLPALPLPLPERTS